MNEVAKPAYPIESVDSVLRVLLMFLNADRVRLTDVAAALDVAPSTAHRLLAMLSYHGFVAHDRQRREYRAGPVFDRLAMAKLRRFDIREIARPVMETLSAKFNETVGLGILHGASVLYVAGVDGNRVVRVGARTGAEIPAYTLAMGKVLLSGLSDAELDELYPSEKLPPLTDRSVATKSELRRQLAEVRRRGYARTVGESDEGVASLAVPIRDAGGAMRAAMAMAAPFFRVSKSDITAWLPAMKRAAEQIGASLT